MRILLLLVIKLYWFMIPKDKRRRCIFKTSCSQFVYQTTKKKGLYNGLIALNYRFQNCKSGFHIFEDAVDESKKMLLPNGEVITEDKIAERFKM